MVLRIACSNEPIVFRAAVLAVSTTSAALSRACPYTSCAASDTGARHPARLLLCVAENAIEIRGFRRFLFHGVALASAMNDL
jgi:hypothetical protein